MNRNAVASLFIIALALFLIPIGLFSQQEKKDSLQIHITSYEISIERYDKPIVRIDEKGNKIRYDKAFVIELKGSFGESGAIPVDIFIGDYKIPEYGGTKDGIYFKIYEEKLLEELEDRPFGYGFENRKLKVFELRFRPSTKKPYPDIKRKEQIK